MKHPTFVKTKHISKIIAQCKYFIENDRKFLLIIDIDDTILSTLPNKELVDPKVRELFGLLCAHGLCKNIVYCTARQCIHYKKTLEQLNQAKLTPHYCTTHRHVILHSPNVDNVPTKCNTVFNYLIGHDVDVNTYVIVVDDDYDQVECIYKQLNMMKYSFTIWHYVAAYH